MKLLFFLLAFAGITAFGVICVAPQLQDYIEGDLEADAKIKLEASKLADQYSVTDVKMDHFHLKQVTLTPKNSGVSLDEDQIKKEVVRIVDPILGIYAQNCDLTLLNTTSEIATVSNNNDGKPPKDGPPPPTETLEDISHKEPASFSISWNAKENTLILKGKQTNTDVGKRLKEYFAEAEKLGKVTSTIKIDNEKVANSKYLKRALREIRLIIMNSDDDLSIDFQDAQTTKEGQKMGHLKCHGITGSLEKYDVLTSGLKNLESDDFEIHNDLVFYSNVSIIKDTKQQKIILTGCVQDRIDVGTLGSNSSRDVDSNFNIDNQLVSHERCLKLTWHDEQAENLIARHMNKVVNGEISYRNNQLVSLSGVSNDAIYVDEMREAFKSKKITPKLIYEEASRDQIQKVESEPVRPESLADQLADYQIYFGRGKSKVDPRYSVLLDGIAHKIIASSDKTSQIIIGAHADATGSAAQNKVLSLARAGSVKDKLVSRGVNTDRLKVEFLGVEAIGKPKAESRRVEIKVIKKQ